MNKKLFALLTLSIIGLTCISETLCMKRRRENNDEEERIAKCFAIFQKTRRKKEEQPQQALSIEPAHEAPEVSVDPSRKHEGHRSVKLSFPVGQAFRVDVKEDGTTIKPISGLTTNQNGATFSPKKGTRTPLLGGECAMFPIQGPNRIITIIGTTNTGMSEGELEAQCANALEQHEHEHANQELSQAMTAYFNEHFQS